MDNNLELLENGALFLEQRTKINEAITALNKLIAEGTVDFEAIPDGIKIIDSGTGKPYFSINKDSNGAIKFNGFDGGGNETTILLLSSASALFQSPPKFSGNPSEDNDLINLKYFKNNLPSGPDFMKIPDSLQLIDTSNQDKPFFRIGSRASGIQRISQLIAIDTNGNQRVLLEFNPSSGIALPKMNWDFRQGVDLSVKEPTGDTNPVTLKYFKNNVPSGEPSLGNDFAFYTNSIYYGVTKSGKRVFAFNGDSGGLNLIDPSDDKEAISLYFTNSVNQNFKDFVLSTRNKSDDSENKVLQFIHGPGNDGIYSYAYFEDLVKGKGFSAHINGKDVFRIVPNDAGGLIFYDNTQLANFLSNAIIFFQPPRWSGTPTDDRDLINKKFIDAQVTDLNNTIGSIRDDVSAKSHEFALKLDGTQNLPSTTIADIEFTPLKITFEDLKPYKILGGAHKLSSEYFTINSAGAIVLSNIIESEIEKIVLSSNIALNNAAWKASVVRLVAYSPIVPDVIKYGDSLNFTADKAVLLAEFSFDGTIGLRRKSGFGDNLWGEVGFEGSQNKIGRNGWIIELQGCCIGETDSIIQAEINIEFKRRISPISPVSPHSAPINPNQYIYSGFSDSPDLLDPSGVVNSINKEKEVDSLPISIEVENVSTNSAYLYIFIPKDLKADAANISIVEGGVNQTGAYQQKEITFNGKEYHRFRTNQKQFQDGTLNTININ